MFVDLRIGPGSAWGLGALSAASGTAPVFVSKGVISLSSSISFGSFTSEFPYPYIIFLRYVRSRFVCPVIPVAGQAAGSLE